jgi:diguanylate cyclase (GGDEF)-like protein
MEQLGNLLAEGDHGIVAIFLDVDNFKPVNDRYGHAAGDEVLVTVARRLHALVRESDLVARLGGDEFLVVGRGLDDVAIGALAGRLHDAINAPVSAGGAVINLRASIGIGPARRDDTPEQLLARADAAMYASKRRGDGAGPVVYADDL